MDAVREKWDRLRAALEEEATLSRQSEAIIEGLKRQYVRLSAADQSAVSSLLGEWLLADDAAKRHDARALVRTSESRRRCPNCASSNDGCCTLPQSARNTNWRWFAR